MNNTACAITGHRPTRFRWKYNENDNDCKRLKQRLKEQLAALYDQGVRRFYIGGALGVDMWSGELLLELKEQPEYGKIELVLVLPFVGYDRDWEPESRRRLSALRQKSTEVIVVGQSENPPTDNYRLRNQYMVDHASCLLAVYDNNRQFRSGTMQTVNYARRKGLPITLIHPDLATVDYEN